MLITVVLRITFANNSKIRIIIVLRIKKTFRKKITAITSIMNIYSSIVSSSNNRVKRNFLSLINSTILHIKIVLIKINQIIVLNNKNRRRLKQINYTKKVFRSRRFKINYTNSLNLYYRRRFNQKTRSICSLNHSNRRSRIVLLMTIISTINIRIDRFTISVSTFQCSKNNAFI